MKDCYSQDIAIKMLKILSDKLKETKIHISV